MGKIPNSEIYGNIFEVMQEYHPSSIFRTYEHRETDDGSAEWKSPTEGMSTFEHLVNFDNYLKKLGMKGSIADKENLDRHGIVLHELPNGLVRNNVHDIKRVQRFKSNLYVK